MSDEEQLNAKWIQRLAILIAASLVTQSCDRPAIDASQSLVGAKKLPPAKELEQEKIVFFFQYDRTMKRQLSLELAPDNSWSAIISEVSADWRELSRRTVRLPSARAHDIRKKLWRIRPEKLDGAAELHYPADCPTPPTDTSIDLSVGFKEEGSNLGVRDDQIGLFALPHLQVCSTPRSVASHQLIDGILDSLPFNELRSQFKYFPPLG